MAGPDNDGTTGDVVRLTQGEWERRAAVAEEAAALLAGAAASLLTISSQNSFGDCVEGRGMQAAVESVISRFATSLGECYSTAEAIQAASLAAGTTLSQTDESISVELGESN